jgi:hypothetical protein
VATVRLDCAVAFSHISQQVSKPTVATLAALKRVFQYLLHTSKLCIASRLYGPEIDLADPSGGDDQAGWEFYTDSDDSVKSRNGFVALEEGAPVSWYSRLTSVSCAHSDIAYWGSSPRYVKWSC